MQDLETVVAALEDIALLLSLSGQDGFKARAYRRGAELVRAMGDKLGTLVAQAALSEVEGIGPSLSKQITELWNTGGSSLLRRLQSEYPPGAAELARVPGMTLRRIRAVYDGLQVASVDELVAACNAQRVRQLPGFGAKTEQRLLDEIEGLRAQPRAEARVLLAEALAISARIERHVLDAGAAAHVALAGAARRREETVAELDMVFATATPAVLWQSLSGLGAVVHADRDRGVAQLTLGIPLRVHTAPPEQAGALLLMATGNETHVEAVRTRAAERDLALSERGLERRGAAPRQSQSPGPSTPRQGQVVGPSTLGSAGATEQAIYAELGLAYVPPELRTSSQQLQLAASGAFHDLLTDADIRGAVHCHTTYSDGKDSIETMARAAEALGMRYITITDHSPSAHYAGGVTLDRLKEQWDEIARVQGLVGIRILRGTESDILGDGSLDYPDAVLEQFDVVIASIHSRLRMARDEMTQRLMRAMSQPVFKIWGHALGRLLLQREPIDCDVLAVLDALAGSRGAIEINGDPNRLDLPPEWIPHARERGISFVVSVDAHSTRGLGVFPLGVMMARRGALTRAEVLNTLDADAFAARVRPV
jgi:DNA polymerase (family 10)